MLPEMLAAAKAAVRAASRVALSVSTAGPISSLAKPDASPVTIADYAAQAAVALTLLHALRGPAASHALLHAAAPPPPDFRMVAEEEAGELARGGPSLLHAVAAALQGGMPPRAEFSAGGVGEVSGAWVPADVERALALSGCPGGLGAEGEGEGRGYWVLDPIDGTKGFLRGGQYAVGLAFVRGGRPVLCAIACPMLPHPAWVDAAGGAPAAGVGTLFTATAGGGAAMEPLFPSAAVAGGSGSNDGALSIHVDGLPHASLTLCESFEASHSNHAASARLAAAVGEELGLRAWGATIQVDSMCKYGLLARGCGHVYLRLPAAGYVEKVWDHAPGALLLAEAGGVVTDTAGGELDFSLGKTLSGNRGVVGACSARVHGAVLRALAGAGEAR